MSCLVYGMPRAAYDLKLSDGGGVQPAAIDLHSLPRVCGLDVEVLSEAIPEPGVDIDEVAEPGVVVVDLTSEVEIEPGVAVSIGPQAGVEPQTVEVELLAVEPLLGLAWTYDGVRVERALDGELYDVFME